MLHLKMELSIYVDRYIGSPAQKNKRSLRQKAFFILLQAI
jgi:hypothetical protein